MVIAFISFVAAGTAWSARRQTVEESARAYVTQNQERLGLSRSDVRAMAVSSEVKSARGVTHVYFQQRYRGIDVHNGILNVSVGRGGKVLSADSRFIPNVASVARGQSVKRSAEEAVAAAAGRLNLARKKPFEVLGRRGGPAEATTISSGGIARKPIDAKLVWMPLESAVRLAWSLDIEEASGQHWWNAFVDAETVSSSGRRT